MFTKASTCWEGPQVFPLVALSQEEEQSETYFLLEDWLCRCGCFTSIRNLGPQERQAGPNWRSSCEEALRAAHQRALDTTKALRSNIERLRQSRGRLRSHSRHCSWSRSHSRDCSQSRSQSRGHCRAQSQCHLQGNLWNVHPISPEGSPPGRRVTFRNLEVEMSSEGGTKSYSMEPSVSDVETWLEWQANQLGNPAWWTELQAIPGIRDPQKLVWKVRALFYIPKVRMRPYWSLGTPFPLHPEVSIGTFSYQMTSPIKMCGKNWPSLTVTYARSLQYWVEKQSLIRHWSLRPLAESVMELREVVKEYVTFNHQDIIHGLGTDEEPQATIFSWVLSSPSENSDVGQTATNTAGTVA